MNGQHFADDAPRRDPWTEDDFGYRPFARRLSDVVFQLQAPNGYVIGLHGVWGAGKTTALNFVDHFVRASNAETKGQPLEIVWFQPWMVSGQLDLISAFFRVLAENIKDGKEAAQKRRRWFGEAAKTVADPVVKAAITVAAAAHPPDKVVLEAGGEIAKNALHQTIDAWLGEPTLQEAHKDLAERLATTGRRFLVIVDDIDRLEPDEIHSIMQMVKSVGRLPNVVYVLAYDRRIVWRALGERDQRLDGEPTFIEKIVQHELELPHIGAGALLRRLGTELKFILDLIEENGRWYEIVQFGLRRWIDSPRDIIRFANALHFAWPPLAGEIDPADVLAMEGVRIFDPGAFAWVRDSRDFLIEPTRYQTDDEQKAHAEAFRGGLHDSQRDQVTSLLATLFPSRSELLTGKRSIGFREIPADTASRRGIGSAKAFDAYFAQDPSQQVISKAMIEEVVENAADQTVQDEAIAKALAMKDDAGQPLIGDFLEEMLNRTVGQHRMQATPAMLTALVKHGEEIQRVEREGATLIPPHIQLQILIREILIQLGPEAAGEALLSAVAVRESASMAASLYVWRAREAGRLPAEGSEVGDLIPTQALDELGQRALDLIHRFTADGRLPDAPFYWDIMLAWGQLEGAEVAKAWLMDTADSSAKNLAKVVKGVLGMSVGSGRKRFYSFQGFRSDRDFFDADRMRAAVIRYVDDPSLTEDERDRIVAVREGLDRP